MIDISKKVKVALMGTHGTRKTTIGHILVGRLREREVNAEFLSEVAREANQKPGLPINEGTRITTQLWIQYEQMAREIEYLARPDVDALVTDRGNLDNYMYLMHHEGRAVPVIDDLVNYWVKTYDLIFKMSIVKDGQLDSDEVRAKSPEFMTSIDQLFEQELIRRKVPFEYYGMNMTKEEALEDALEKIIAVIDKKRT